MKSKNESKSKKQPWSLKNKSMCFELYSILLLLQRLLNDNVHTHGTFKTKDETTIIDLSANLPDLTSFYFYIISEKPAKD